MPSINYKSADGTYSKVKTPFIKQAGGWLAAKKVSVKTEGGWKEVWPGVVIYTHVGVGYNMSIAACFGNPGDVGNYIFINDGTILATTTGTAALVSGGFAPGSTLTVINNGTIGGKGGQPEQGGGPAFDANYGLALTNNGMIGGGGGGGGTGGGAQMKSGGNNAVWAYGGVGGVGQGTDGPQPGAFGQKVINLNYYPNPPQDPPVPLLDGTDGASGAGGEGGPWGTAGRAGYMYWANTLYSAIQPTPGGPGGPSIRGSGNVAFVVYGDIRGPLQ